MIALSPHHDPSILNAWKSWVTLAALLIAFLAFWSNRSFQTRIALSRLLERFETRRFDLLMWRMEQVSRQGHKLGSIHRVDIDDLKQSLSNEPQPKAKLRLVEGALSQNWSRYEAHMHDVYFFALQVHAWLCPTRFWRYRSKTRLLNNTFGYQLLTTFLDHGIVACRLVKKGKPDSYYQTQYGLEDPAYIDLVTRLAADFLRDTNPLPAGIRSPIEDRWTNLRPKLESSTYIGSSPKRRLKRPLKHFR